MRVCRKTENAVLHITKAGKGEMFMVAPVTGACEAAKVAEHLYGLIAETLQSESMAIVHERIFGSLSIEASVMKARNKALSPMNIPFDDPLTYIQGNPPWGDGLSGVIIHAVSSDDVWTIFDNGMFCGKGWRKNGSTWLMLQNINGSGGSPSEIGSRTHQVRQMIDRADRILRENGSSFSDVLRTWFYLSHILGWYAEFNNVRNEKYGEFGIMPGPWDMNLLLPASTGISGDSPSGAAATMDLLAIVGGSKKRTAVKQLTNKVQLDAFRYGSAFSRGALVREHALSLLEISGTAAIDEHGKSLFADDIRSQMTCTFDKMESLLKQAGGAALGDICAATVFMKKPEDAVIFQEIARTRGLDDFPAVCIIADVCREELMFEMDAEAFIMKGFKGGRRLKDRRYLK